MPVPAMAAATARSFFWEVFPPMRTCRVYCSPAYQDGHLFVVGGCGQAGLPLDTVEMLDVHSQKWTVLPALPTPRAGAAAVAVGKQVLVMGGMDSRQSPLASVEVFNTDEGKWEKVAALAQPSMGISAIERDGLVYALGGMGADTSPQALVRVYDPATTHWQPLPSMPTPCYGASAFLQGNKIFLLGRANCPSRPSRASTCRRGAGRAIPASPAGGPLPAAPWLMAASSASGACSNRDPTTSTPGLTLSTRWRCSTRSRGPGASRAAPCACGRREPTSWLAASAGEWWWPEASGTSRFPWVQWKDLAYQGRSGSCFPPCPPVVAPAPATKPRACCL
ncbi:kelch domain-containing protein 8B isoform X2 [Mauremys mutica]|uniref:kelch domain-containing protein 8B isoform X2 n=1 Tax=Mauremys mutica TaxID=74926 RepID=UPI001D16094D|nr:kelch domain-containing protein 8B isoform X2 [Mauremys mutica]